MCDKDTFASQTALKEHIGRQHLPDASHEQLEALAAHGARPASTNTTHPCPICNHTLSGQKQYIKHVGRHLEQVALFALPTLEDDCEEQGDDDAGSDEQNTADSVASSLPSVQQLEKESGDEPLSGVDEVQQEPLEPMVWITDTTNHDPASIQELSQVCLVTACDAPRQTEKVLNGMAFPVESEFCNLHTCEYADLAGLLAGKNDVHRLCLEAKHELRRYCSQHTGALKCNFIDSLGRKCSQRREAPDNTAWYCESHCCTQQGCSEPVADIKMRFCKAHGSCGVNGCTSLADFSQNSGCCTQHTCTGAEGCSQVALVGGRCEVHKLAGDRDSSTASTLQDKKEYAWEPGTIVQVDNIPLDASQEELEHIMRMLPRGEFGRVRYVLASTPDGVNHPPLLAMQFRTVSLATRAQGILNGQVLRNAHTGGLRATLKGTPMDSSRSGAFVDPAETMRERIRFIPDEEKGISPALEEIRSEWVTTMTRKRKLAEAKEKAGTAVQLDHAAKHGDAKIAYTEAQDLLQDAMQQVDGEDRKRLQEIVSYY